MIETNKLLVILKRLETHLDSVSRGIPGARDDLSVVMQILVGDGNGYNQISHAVHELGIGEPVMPGWADANLPIAECGNKTILDIRAISIQAPHAIPLSVFLRQKCLKFVPDDSSHGIDWTWQKVIEISRHNYGAHGAETPHRLLEQLRYFPASGADTLTLLLWSMGEKILESTCVALSESGIAIEAYPTDMSLNSIKFERGRILLTQTDHIIADAEVLLTASPIQIQPLIGGICRGRPVILAINTDRKVLLQLGGEGATLDQLITNFY